MEQHDLMVRAAWLYHVEGLTQAEIADRLNLTRRRVNEMLATALETGVVTIGFNSQLAACAKLEGELRARFGLDDAVVTPTPVDAAQLHSVLGRATAGYLNRIIATRKPKSIGVGWGSTLKETVHFLAPINAPDMEVHSMMGGLTHGSEINTFEIVRGFAQALNASCRYFVAPIYADTPESRDAIISQTVFRNAFQQICDVDIACLSVGDVSERSLQVRYGLPAGTTGEELLRAGAVGDLIGRYLDAGGMPIEHSINRQVLAPELDRFRQIACRIIASGGPHKCDILRAVAQTKLATVIITDEDSARGMLA